MGERPGLRMARLSTGEVLIPLIRDYWASLRRAFYSSPRRGAGRRGVQFVASPGEGREVKGTWDPAAEIADGRMGGMGLFSADTLLGAAVFSIAKGAFDIRFCHLLRGADSAENGRRLVEAVLDTEEGRLYEARLKSPSRLSQEESDRAFLPLGFVGFSRIRMAAGLPPRAAPPREALPPGHRIASLAEHPVPDPGLTAYRWYRGTVDGLLVLEPTLEGCRNTYEGLISGKQGNFSEQDSLVLLREGEVVGVCYVTRSRNRAHIGDLSLAPDVRGRGVGRSFLQAALCWITRRRCAAVELEVTGENRRALSLYRALGFETRGVFHHYVRREWGEDSVFPASIRRRLARAGGGAVWQQLLG